MDDHPLKKSKKPPPPPIPAPSDSDSPSPAEASHQNFPQMLSTSVACQNVDCVWVVSSLDEKICQTSRQPERAAKEREGGKREKREEDQRKEASEIRGERQNEACIWEC